MKIFYKLAMLVLFTNTHVTLGVTANNNQITQEFDDNIENKKDFDRKIDMYRTNSISSVNNEIMSEIFAPKRDNHLEELGVDSIEILGREERNKKEHIYFNDFETDFTKPGSSQYKIDIKKVVNHTEKTLKNLTKLLRDTGIECIEEKSNKDEIIDPNFIEMNLEENKEVDYQEHFCEQPRNTYNCLDVMTISCLEKGWSAHPWQEHPREFQFSANDILSKHWHFAIFWKKKRNGIHMRGGPGVREEIAKRLGVHLGHIHEDLMVSHRGNGEPYLEVAPQYFAWATYTVKYKYRDGYEICNKWSEERWDESCNISSR
jgi:hypothetical protein